MTEFLPHLDPFQRWSVRQRPNSWHWGGTFGSVPIELQAQLVEVSAGLDHALGIDYNGRLWAVGDNTYYQLGDNTTTASSVWKMIDDTAMWLKVSAGQYCSLGIARADAGSGIIDGLYGWGDNSAYQLGNGTTTNLQVPTLVGGTGSSWIDVSTYITSMAVNSASGQMYYTAAAGATSWTASGETGYFKVHTFDDKNGNPVAAHGITASGIRRWTDLSAASTSIVTGSILQMWAGAGTDWVLIRAADNTLYQYYLSSTSQINTDEFLWLDGDLICRADRTVWFVQFGGVAAFPTTALRDASRWNVLAAGGDVTIGIDSRGYMNGTGPNTYGQLGLGDVTAHDDLSDFTGCKARDFVKMATSGTHTLAIDSEGNLWAWGRNNSGQLGIGSVDISAHPDPILVSGPLTGAFGSQPWVHVDCYGETSLAICQPTGAAVSDLYMWGDNTYYQLGTGDNVARSSPTLVEYSGGALYAKDAAVGLGHTVIINGSGYLQSWGLNDQGQLGLGDTTARTSVQAPITGIGTPEPQFLSIHCGDKHTAAVSIAALNYVYTTGRNNEGQLGLGDNTDRNVFTQTARSGAATTCGKNFTLAGAYGTGDNSSGQLGDGTTTNRNNWTAQGYIPMNLAIFYGAGDSHSLGGSQLSTADYYFGWVCGDNTNDQLGIPTSSGETSPRPVPGSRMYKVSGCSSGLKAAGRDYRDYTARTKNTIAVAASESGTLSNT